MSDRRLGEIAKTLVAARAWLSDPEHWCKCAYGLPTKDVCAGNINTTEPLDLSRAEQTCLVGAIMKAKGTCAIGTRIMNVLGKVAREHYHTITPMEFNDDNETTHEMVLEFLDKTIQLAINEGV